MTGLDQPAEAGVSGAVVPSLSALAPRSEWSKGWDNTAAGPWTNTTMLSSTIPAGVNAGQSGDVFGGAVAALNAYDANGVFSNTFLSTFLS